MTKNNNWHPSATIAHLRQRSHIINTIRCFFAKRGYLEVETPIMVHHGITDVYLSNIKATFRQKTYYLQTSPEYHMKRLLAAGSGPIYQLARVFRDDELGRWHNPEFTLLEWYQLDVDHYVLMQEVDALLQIVLHSSPAQKITYQDIFLHYCKIDPFAVTVAELRQCLKRFELDSALPYDESELDAYLFLLMSHVIEPALAKESTPIVVYHFPPSQAALAQVNEGVGERFEFYYQGVELANGFHELVDSALQKQRFEDDVAKRAARNLEQPTFDYWFLAALEHGLPPCSGVALGVDRLIALACKQQTIAQTLAFDFLRA